MIKIPVLIAVAAAAACHAQQPRQFQAQSLSTIVTTGPAGSETVDITNVAYEVTGSSIPGRPRDQRLVLRKTMHSRQVTDEIGMEASTTLDAWPFPGDLKQKPIYSLTVSGSDARTVDGSLVVVSRGLEEVDWWSVYKLGTAEHLFDTYVPLTGFSISRQIVKQRYAGLEVPPDDTADARLKEAHVVAVLTYASAERVIREALITCDEPRQASLLRSYSDTARTVTLVETSPPGAALRIAFSQVYPSTPSTVTVQVPVAGDDLDLARAQVAPRLHIAAWKR